MAGDASANTFESGRANLRDTAKWMISGIVGVAGLIVGASTISQLGAMDPSGWRFRVAVAALAMAILLCWIPFTKAIAVLRSEVLSLRAFTEADDGELADAAQNIQALARPDIPNQLSLKQFVDQYVDLRRAAFNAAHNADDAQRDVADLDDRYQRIRQACISELVGVRFDALRDSLAFPGVIILGAFLIFAWAANPSKDAVKLFDKPVLEPLTAQRLAKLKAEKVRPACLAPGAQLIAVATPEAGHETALLTAPSCSPVKVTLSAGEIIQVEATAE